MEPDLNQYRKLEEKINKSQFDLERMTELIDSTIEALQTIKSSLKAESANIANCRSEVVLGIQALIKRDQELSHDKLQFEKEAEFIRQIQNQSQVWSDALFLTHEQNQITLNVGGEIITTTRDTLCGKKNNMLSAMFSGRHKLDIDSEGRYFLERDPKYFKIVLEYLRNGKVSLPTDDVLDENGASIRTRIMSEFDYFCIPLKGHLKSTNFVCHQKIQGHADKVRFLKSSSRSFASCSDDGFVKIWDLELGECSHQLNCGDSKVEKLDYDGETVCYTEREKEGDEYVSIWKVGQKKNETIRIKQRDPIYWLKMQNNNVITCGYEFAYISRTTNTLANRFGRVHGNLYWCMDVALDNSFVASGHNDGLISCWDPRSGKMTTSMKAHSDGVNQIIIQGDNLVSCGDLTIKIFDFKTNKCRKTLEGHLKTVYSIDCAENMLISGSCDKSISLWELESGMCHKTFFNHLRAVQSVSICGQDTFISGDFDGRINIWVAN